MKIGIDIQQITRIDRFVRNGNIGRVFSDTELEYIRGKNYASNTVAGMWCAKEAYFKALGTGLLRSRLKSVEILHDPRGAPYLNIPNTTLSISHTADTAVAVCVILGKPQSHPYI